MALISPETVIKKILAGLDKLPPEHGYEVLSYKRNRGLDILRIDSDLVLVRERGYREAEYRVAPGELGKLLKSLCKYEFPRSRQLRLYQITSPDELNQPRKKL